MYLGGSVVGKASIIGIEISPTPPLFLQGSKSAKFGFVFKVRNLASFSTPLNYEPPAFENAARYPNAETNFLCQNDLSMLQPSLVKFGPRTLEYRSVKVPHP